MTNRGAICWVDLGDPGVGSAPAKRRPVVVIQGDPYNRSRLASVVVAVVSSNTTLSAFPGNVALPGALSGLAKDSVVNVTALHTCNKRDLDAPVGRVPEHLMAEVDQGLRMVLGL